MAANNISDIGKKVRTVLVIGGAGYIGSVLVRKLLADGYRVRVLDKLMYGNGSSISDLLIHENFAFIQGDFGEESMLENALIGVTDVVLLAALVGDPICRKYPDLAKKTHLTHSKRLLEKLTNRQIQKFVFTSTCSNYGLITDDTPARESSELNPKSLYAETKVAFEQHVLEHLDEFDFCPTLLRISTAFGISNRMRFDLTISEFTRELALGKKLLVYDENTWRPYCHVTDISRAIMKVLEAPVEKVHGEVFNVGGNQSNFTKKMVVELVQSHLDQSEVEYKIGDFDPRNYRVSFDKIKKTLNFEPRYTVDRSVQQLIKALKNGLFSDMEDRKNFYGNYFIQD